MHNGATPIDIQATDRKSYNLEYNVGLSCGYGECTVNVENKTEAWFKSMETIIVLC